MATAAVETRVSEPTTASKLNRYKPFSAPTLPLTPTTAPQNAHIPPNGRSTAAPLLTTLFRPSFCSAFFAATRSGGSGYTTHHPPPPPRAALSITAAARGAVAAGESLLSVICLLRDGAGHAPAFLKYARCEDAHCVQRLRVTIQPLATSCNYF